MKQELLKTKSMHEAQVLLMFFLTESYLRKTKRMLSMQVLLMFFLTKINLRKTFKGVSS